ncbi:MAG: nucleotide pyrophosphohydrolase [Pseudobdellovibrionaceae bacterium]
MARAKTSELNELAAFIGKFCQKRDWDQFHNPKDLAIGVSTEAGELLDLFRFKNLSDVAALLKETEFRIRYEEELADVFFFILRLASTTDVDLKRALLKKIKKNAKKYPVSKAKGSNKKYNQL